MASDKEMFGANIIKMMKAQFGNAVKAFWFYDGDFCPCCGGEIDEMVYKGQRTVSVNAFMYRQHGVLIGYFLCGQCATAIHEHGKYEKMDQHVAIEDNLKKAYRRHINSLDA